MPRQPELLQRSKTPTIAIADNHRLVQLADTLDWDELQQRAQQIRRAKLKNGAVNHRICVPPWAPWY